MSRSPNSSLLCGFDDDLAGQITQVSNRVRGLLTQIHPALERVIGPRLDHPAILDLLQHYPSAAAMKTAGEKRLGNRLLKNAPRKAAPGRERSSPRSASRPSS